MWARTNARPSVLTTWDTTAELGDQIPRVDGRLYYRTVIRRPALRRGTLNRLWFVVQKASSTSVRGVCFIERLRDPMFYRKPALLLLTQASLTGLAIAQTLPPVTPPSTTLPTYQSALDGYQPFADEKLAPWKESNDNVGRIGGWRAYAKEASGGGSAPIAAPVGAASAASPPAPAARPPAASAPPAPATGATPTSVVAPPPVAAPPASAAPPSGSHGKH